MSRSTFTLLAFFLVLPICSVYAADMVGGELSVSSASQLLVVGEPFDVSVRANTHGQSVNAIEGEIAYSPSDFSIEKISVDGSILTSWSTVPSYDSAAGTIRFSGWAGHAFAGTDGLVITITLVPLRVGESSLDFNSGTMLASGGQGNNIITTMKSSSFRIEPKQVQIPAPALSPQAATSAPGIDEDISPTVQTPVVPPATTTAVAPVALAASPLFSGVELAPIFIPFFVLLVLVAFGIAYILHRWIH